MLFLWRLHERLDPPVRAPGTATDRERRLERALRLARAMISRQEEADHATLTVIDNALRPD